jgi:hypothetical protein
MKDETKLETAARHVAEARRIVAQQRARIERLKSVGGGVADAERLLTTFVITLGSLEHHEQSLQSMQMATGGHRPAHDRTKQLQRVQSRGGVLEVALDSPLFG